MKYTAKVHGIPPEQFSSLKAARAWIRTRSVRDGVRYVVERNDEPDPLKRMVEAGQIASGTMFRDR